MTDLVELTPEACMRLLAGEEVGRIAFAEDDDYPVVLPVNYRLDGALIVFRTAEGLKLESVPLRRVAVRGRPIRSFDEDRVERPRARPRHGGDVRVGEPYESLRSGPLAPWAPGSKDYWVAVDIESITGRQIIASRG